MPGLGEIALICICGGALGVFFMIPLRSALLYRSMGVLPYPEERPVQKYCWQEKKVEPKQERFLQDLG